MNDIPISCDERGGVRSVTHLSQPINKPASNIYLNKYLQLLFLVVCFFFLLLNILRKVIFDL